MTARIEMLPHRAAGPISLLHAACFPEDPWDSEAIDQIMGISGFFGRVGWVKNDPIGFALAIALGDEAEIVSLDPSTDCGAVADAAGKMLLSSSTL